MGIASPSRPWRNGVRHLEFDIRCHRICDNTGNGAVAAGPVRHYSMCVCACGLGRHRIRPYRNDAFQSVCNLGHRTAGRSCDGWLVWWLRCRAAGLALGLLVGRRFRSSLRVFSRSGHSPIVAFREECVFSKSQGRLDPPIHSICFELQHSACLQWRSLSSAPCCG